MIMNELICGQLLEDLGKVDTNMAAKRQRSDLLTTTLRRQQRWTLWSRCVRDWKLHDRSPRSTPHTRKIALPNKSHTSESVQLDSSLRNEVGDGLRLRSVYKQPRRVVDEPVDAGESSGAQTTAGGGSSGAGRDARTTGDMNGVATSGGSGGGNAAAGGSGGEKPPPQNNQTKSVNSKVDMTSEEEIDDDEETTSPKKRKKSKHSSRKKRKKNKSMAHKKKATHVNAAEPSNTETSTVRGKALGKYRRTAAKLSTVSDRRPYATFNMSAAEVSEAPTTVMEFTETPSEVPTEFVSEYPSTLPSAQQSSLQVEAPSEVSLLDHPSQSEVTTVDVSTWKVSSEEEEKVSLLNWDEVLDPWEFSDSEISSNNEQDNWSAANDFEGERNTEWIQVLDRRRGHKGPEGKGNPQPSKPRGKALPKEPDFLRVMMPLYRFMTLCGRFPFKIVKSSDGSYKTFVFDKTSKEYRVFFVTSVFFCLCAVLMTINMVEILLLAPPLSDYNQVIALEFDKYWLEGVMAMLWLYFITLSSASMVVGGRGVSEMLNRWVESLELIGYNGTWGLRSRLTLVYLGVFLVFGLFVVGFVMDVGHVRGSWGFEGLLILHYFERGLRLDFVWYRAAEILGLVVDLYASLAATFTLTLIGVHAWTLDNAARRFNLRLGLTLGSLTFRTPDDVPLPYRKLVPYRKLFAEFLVISSFPKVIGAAFLFTINTFFGFLMAGMVVTLYGMYTAVILEQTTLNGDSTDNPNEYNVTGLAEPGQFIPVKINKPPESRFWNEAWLAASVWGIGIVFLELLQLPGATIMEGSRFVLRRGFVNCKNVFERRFVASMIFSYSPPALSCIRPGYSINRRFIGKFIGFTFGVFMIIVQFNPHRLQTESFLYCESLEQCVVITASKVAQTLPEVQKALQRLKKKPKSADSDDDGGYGDAPLFPLPKIPEILRFPTCASNGRRLVEPPDFTTDCGHARVPNLFTKTVNGTFSRVPVPCNNTIPPQNASGGDLFDCFGGKVDFGMTDECGNLFLSTPNSSGETQKPIVRVAVINYGSVFCCFTYPHKDLKDQGNDCNIPRSDRGNRYNLCKEKNLTNPAGVKMPSTTPYFAPTATSTAIAATTTIAVSTTSAAPSPTGTTKQNPTSLAVAVDLMKSWRKQFLEERKKNPDQLRDNETLKVQWAECLCHGIPGIQASMKSCGGLNTTEPATPQTTTVSIPPPTTTSTSTLPTTTTSTSTLPTTTTSTSTLPTTTTSTSTLPTTTTSTSTLPTTTTSTSTLPTTTTSTSTLPTTTTSTSTLPTTTTSTSTLPTTTTRLPTTTTSTSTLPTTTTSTSTLPTTTTSTSTLPTTTTSTSTLPTTTTSTSTLPTTTTRLPTTTTSTSTLPTTTTSTSTLPTTTTSTSTLPTWLVFNKSLWASQNKSEIRRKLREAKLFVECDVNDPAKPSKLFRLGVFEKDNLTDTLKVRYLNDPKDPTVCDPVVDRQQLKTNGTLYNSFWEPVNTTEFLDDCGNLKLAFPYTPTGIKLEPDLLGKRLDDVKSTKFRFVYVCCWDYERHKLDPSSGKYTGDCNLPKNSNFTNICAVRGIQNKMPQSNMNRNCMEVFKNQNRVNARYQELCYEHGVTRCNNTQTWP